MSWQGCLLLWSNAYLIAFAKKSLGKMAEHLDQCYTLVTCILAAVYRLSVSHSRSRNTMSTPAEDQERQHMQHLVAFTWCVSSAVTETGLACLSR